MSESIKATAIGILIINLLTVQLKALENNAKVVVPVTLIRFFSVILGANNMKPRMTVLFGLDLGFFQLALYFFLV